MSVKKILLSDCLALDIADYYQSLLPSRVQLDRYNLAYIDWLRDQGIERVDTRMFYTDPENATLLALKYSK